VTCKIQTALTQEWFAATEQFSAAIKAMTGGQIATMPNTEYVVLRAAAEKARLASENARLSLELHRHEHGC
jgi:hypothetical protein